MQLQEHLQNEPSHITSMWMKEQRLKAPLMPLLGSGPLRVTMSMASNTLNSFAFFFLASHEWYYTRYIHFCLTSFTQS